MPGFFRKTLSFLGFIDEDYEEPVSGKNPVRSRKGYSARNNPPERNVLEVYRNDEKSIDESKRTGTNWFRSSRKITNLKEVRMEKKTKVFVIEPNGYEDSQVIGDKFKSDIPVIVNLQNENPEISKRIIDFCSGLTYALNGSIEKVAEKVFLITPYNVEVTSEEKEMLKEKGFYEEI
ncbi:MAG TPA: cell division protein SepF [Actinobacteria bacterium]|jgi:cell division inhibitor SepF|nr:cell division protein SepF [Actinomycetota bacterium]